MKKKDFVEFVRELFERSGEHTPLTVLDKACAIFLERGSCDEEALMNALKIESSVLDSDLRFLRENYLLESSSGRVMPTPIGIMLNSNIQNLQKVYEEHCNPPPRLRQPLAVLPPDRRDFIVMLDMHIDECQGFVDKQSQLEKVIKTLSQKMGQDYELIEKDANEVLKMFSEISDNINLILEKYGAISKRICQ